MKLRDLPSVDELAREAGDPLAVEAARAVIDRAREEIQAGADPGDLTSRLREELAQVIVPRAALALGEVVLEVRVAARDLVDGGAGGGRERGAPEVRVEHDAGRVDHAAQRRPGELGRQRGDLDRRDLRRRRRACEDRLAACGDAASRGLDHRPPRRDVAERGRLVGEGVHGGELRQAWIGHGQTLPGYVRIVG